MDRTFLITIGQLPHDAVTFYDTANGIAGVMNKAKTMIQTIWEESYDPLKHFIRIVEQAPEE